MFYQKRFKTGVSLLPLGAALALSLACVAAAQTLPTPSASLLNALVAARSAGLGNLVAWVQRQPVPVASRTAVDGAVATILALSPPDRDALVYWLNAHGRGALHARGASDAEIGIPFYPIDYALTPAPFPGSVQPLIVPSPVPAAVPAQQPHTHFGFLGSLLPSLNIPIASSSSSSSSTTTTQNGNATQIDKSFQSSGTSVSVGGNPWEAVGSLIDSAVARSSTSAATQASAWTTLPFAASAQASTGSQIGVNRGFAAVRSDGTEGIACISFVNQSVKPVVQVDVDIEVLNSLGLIKRVQALKRAGTFAPGAEVGGPSGPQTVSEARANCVIDGEQSLADPSDPFSGASGLAYSVRQVFYADGTSWLQPGANAWGQ